MTRVVSVAMLFVVALAAPLAIMAQPAKRVPRVGFLSVDTAADSSAAIDAFRQGLRELGHIDGQNIAVEWRFAAGRLDRLAPLAIELVGMPLDLAVTSDHLIAQTLRAAGPSLPIVLAGADLRWSATGNMASPSGNMTGVSSIGTELESKRMEILKEAVPTVSRVAVLRDLTIGTNPRDNAIFRTERWGLTFIAIPVRGPDDFERAFATAAKERVGALSVPTFPLFHSQRRRLAELAMKGRLIWIASDRQYATAGSLMSYGADPNDLIRRSASYVDRILKGAKPINLPIEQPTKFELVINLKTAKALGLTIPPSVLARADEVIQ
jgi:putative tryptophan/tyrosine transport system substrate-binding protein